MDNIDITDSAFCLEVPNLNNITSSGESIIVDYYVTVLYNCSRLCFDLGYEHCDFTLARLI